MGNIGEVITSFKNQVYNVQGTRTPLLSIGRGDAEQRNTGNDYISYKFNAKVKDEETIIVISGQVLFSVGERLVKS